MRGRSTLPLLSRAIPSRSNSPGPSFSFDVYTATPPPPPSSSIPIPAIRLVQATPSPDSTANPDSSLLAPREHPSPRKKLVPKKSKLALLASRATSSSSKREKDLSDVVRRVGDTWGMNEDGACNITVNGGNARPRAWSRDRSSRSTIDIYVDPADDPDIGEIVVVKKKKSRAGLAGIRWALGDATNSTGEGVPKEDGEKVKIKVEEKEKWWSIARGRRDSKNKDKDKDKDTTAKVKLRPKAPSASAVPSSSTPAVPPTRTRNHSLDSGKLLCVPSVTNTPRVAVPTNPPDERPHDYFSAHPYTQSHYAQSRPRFDSNPGLLVPPDSGYSSTGFAVNPVPVPEAKSGSLAVRAMRSMKSLARIGSWAQLKNMPTPDAPDAHPSASVTSLGRVKKAKTKGVDAKRAKSSSSSWEVGAPSNGGGDDTMHSRHGTMSALGNGLPSSHPSSLQHRPEDRRDSAGTLLSVATGSGSYRTSSSSSSGVSGPGPGAAGNRVSVLGSSGGSRPGSTYTASGEDTAGFGPVRKPKGSVRWGDTVVGGESKEERARREKKEKKKEKLEKKEKKAQEKKEKEKRNSGRSVEGRRRTPVMSLFPGLVVQAASPESVRHEEPQIQVAVRMPVPQFQPQTRAVFPSRVQEHEEPTQDFPVPAARPRPRPVSEQLLGTSRPRPRGIVGSVELKEGDTLALSVLEAANSDLASLINRLDLQATPDSKASRPVSFAPTDPTVSSRFTLGEPESPSTTRGGGGDDSPLKKTSGARASITSLRPYSQSRGKTEAGMGNFHTGSSGITVGRAAVPPMPPIIGQPIMPWSSLVPKQAKEKESLPQKPSSLSLQARQNRFALAVAQGGDDAVPALQPLRPPKPQRPPPPAVAELRLSTSSTESQIRTSSPELRARAAPFIRTPSVSSTFGSSQVAGKAIATATPSPNDPASPSSRTFGGAGPARYALPSVQSGSLSPGSVTTAGTPTPSPRPHQQGHIRRSSSLVPFVKRAVEHIEARSARDQDTPRSGSRPPSAELDAGARRELGFRGTMGGGSAEAETLKEEDEGSDIPDELQVILFSQSDDTSKMGAVPVDAAEDTLSFVPPLNAAASASASLSTSMSSRLPPSPGLPPAAPLPTPTSTSGILTGPSLEPSPPAPTLLPFLDPSPSPSPFLAPPVAPAVTVRPVSDDGDNEADVDEPNIGSSGSEDDTKQSFDFTGELQRLNESGAAHRRSFVEQLENAFKTPSKLGAQELAFEMNGFLASGALGDKHKADESVAMDRDRVAFEHAKDDVPGMTDSADSHSNRLKPMSSVTSRPSYGRLDTAFKFGGKPQQQADDGKFDNSVARELPGVAALSTSPSPEHVPSALPRRPSRASSVSMVEEDSSVLRSIYAQAAQNVERAGHGKEASLALESDTSSKRRARRSQVPAHARSSSDTSFSGMSSFGAVRTKFEFGHQRPAFFPPTFEAVTSHARHDSMFSIASVSSYGELINNGLNDPFNYAMLSHEGTADRDGLTSINEAISTFDEERHRKRFSTDSDVSSFYFRAPSQPHVTQQHGRDQSVISTTSMNGPPISLYNRSFGHNRSDSAGSGSSLAHAYGMHGASGGRAAWVRHQKDRSIDSVMSGFSAMRLGRPGVGDKMFESAADHGPLTAISASPPESVKADLARKSSYDSILDDDRRSTVDSIFDHTGQRSSMSSGSVFGYDANEPARGNLFPPTHFRPLSVISLGNPGTPREDDTMISMLGGGHVRRRSIGSSFEASPCFRHEKREKRKHSDSAHPFGYDDGSPNKARLIRRESVASTTSSKSKFGETRMTLAQSGLLHRNSLEDSCLSGEGEEDYTMHSVRSPIFPRPTPSSRSHSRPLVTISQPPDTTPPLSSSEGSQSGESQSSIDIARLKVLLQTASAGSRSSNVRARAKGHGHRRRASQVSRVSAIDTIQEEVPGLSNSPSPCRRPNKNGFQNSSSVPPSPRDPVSSAEPSVEVVQWDDDRRVTGLRKYYALRSEADDTISHSRIVWPDTPFSVHALQTFIPPDHPAGMQALLEHSQKSYIPLPSDLRPRRIRSRKSSLHRPAPYPRTANRTLSPYSTKSCSSSVDVSISSSFDKSRALQPISVPDNLTSPAPALAAFTPISPLVVDLSHSEDHIPIPQSVIKPNVRPRVGSAARRNALGWTKRRTPKTADGKLFHANKENEAHGILTSPTESLRIVRPRPRGRTAPPVPPTPRSISLLV